VWSRFIPFDVRGEHEAEEFLAGNFIEAARAEEARARQLFIEQGLETVDEDDTSLFAYRPICEPDGRVVVEYVFLCFASYAGGDKVWDAYTRSAEVVAAKAGIALPPGKTFLMVEEDRIGTQHLFSTEKLGVVLAIFKANGFDHALDLVRQIFDTGGKGHSCGIYSFDDEHIDRLALVAPVSRIMVRQIQSAANAGTFTNGMPMTSSMGCGIWGGNITNENISLKHYMNVTWVSRPIPEDRPSEEELFGEFYNSTIFDPVGAAQ